MTEPTTLTHDSDRLRSALSGHLIAPGDAEYDEARQVFNAGVDRRPALIVRAAGAADVALAVSHARESGLPLAVRGGGHSFAGHGVADGALLLDTAAMRGLEIDPDGRSAWAEAGLTAGEYTDAAGRHGLATGFGDTGRVGIAGITLGGGMGWLVRKHGLTVDDLLAVELVTADGELRHVDAEREPDLFWALRGGGGNFGVVTRLRYRLQELPRILGGMLILPATPEAVRSFVEAASAAPDELTAMATVAKAPPMPMIPAEHHGSLVLMVMLAYAGDPEAGERAIAPLRQLGAPLVDGIREMAYPEIYALGEGGPERAVMAVRSAFADELDDRAIETILERVAGATSDMAMTQIRLLGGAMARVPADATAFAHRDRRMMLTVGAMSMGGQSLAELDDWVGDYGAALGFPGSGVYVNYIGNEDAARVREAYPGAIWDRLVEVKRRYDPHNLFRLNHNITP